MQITRQKIEEMAQRVLSLDEFQDLRVGGCGLGVDMALKALEEGPAADYYSRCPDPMMPPLAGHTERGTASEATRQLRAARKLLDHSQFMRKHHGFCRDKSNAKNETRQETLALRVLRQLLNESLCEDMGLPYNPNKDEQYCYHIRIRDGWKIFAHKDLAELTAEQRNDHRFSGRFFIHAF